MPDIRPRTGLIEAARLLLETAALEPPREDITGTEISALYGVVNQANQLLLSYTIAPAVQELRDGALGAAVELQKAMWILQGAWLERYANTPITNVYPIPLRRTG